MSLIKIFSTMILAIAAVLGVAQVADVQVKDCNNAQSSIYSVLGSGKVLVVASEGLDCSKCAAKAPALQSWALQNSSGISVWGAMTNTYSNNIPNCSDVTGWVNNYGWNNIFSFIDTNEFWFEAGTPRFTVYNPGDTSIAYQGYDESLAKNIAEQLASGVSVGISENSEKGFFITQSDQFVGLHHLPNTVIDVSLVSITGKVVRSLRYEVDSDLIKVPITGLNTGIYLVSAQNNFGFKAVRKIHIK